MKKISKLIFRNETALKMFLFGSGVSVAQRLLVPLEWVRILSSEEALLSFITNNYWKETWSSL